MSDSSVRDVRRRAVDAGESYLVESCDRYLTAMAIVDRISPIIAAEDAIVGQRPEMLREMKELADRAAARGCANVAEACVLVAKSPDVPTLVELRRILDGVAAEFARHREGASRSFDPLGFRSEETNDVVRKREDIRAGLLQLKRIRRERGQSLALDDCDAAIESIDGVSGATLDCVQRMVERATLSSATRFDI